MAKDEPDTSGGPEFLEDLPPEVLELKSLAERLQWAFEHQLMPDGKRISYRAVTRTAKEMGLRSVSPTTVSRVVSGENPNPSVDILSAFAQTLNVTFKLFDLNASGEPDPRTAKLLEAMQTAGVESIAMRSVGLTSESMDMIMGLLDRVRESEGLPPVNDSQRKPK